MDRLAAIVRAQPALLALGFITLVALLLGVFFYLTMSRAGVSLRPLVFMGVFFGLIIVPQAVLQIVAALGYVEVPRDVVPASAGPAGARAADTLPPAPAMPAGTRASLAREALDAAGGRFRDPARLFGADADPALTRDAAPIFGDALAEAEVAQTALFPSGETVLAARVVGTDAAREARERYLRFFQVASPGSPREPVATVRRPNGDLARLVVADDALLVWTASDERTLEARAARIAALSLVPPAAGTAPTSATPNTTPNTTPNATPSAAARPPIRLGWPFMTGWLAINVVAAALWFFKGSAWASGIPARPAPAAASAADLHRRLLAVGEGDVPFAVAAGPEPGTVEVGWRYTDPSWRERMRAGGVERAHRLVLHLDESARDVRVSEYWSALSWSAGGAGAGLSWQRGGGITFFEARREYTVDVSRDGRGRPAVPTTGAYTYDLQAMKQPFIDIVTAAGWDWRPVVWNAPPWLRWATE